MGKSAKVSRSGMQGFTKQKKLAKNEGGIHKQPPSKQEEQKRTVKASVPKKPAAARLPHKKQ